MKLTRGQVEAIVSLRNTTIEHLSKLLGLNPDIIRRVMFQGGYKRSLTPEDWADIQASSAPAKDLANLYHVTPRSIYRIKRYGKNCSGR